MLKLNFYEALAWLSLFYAFCSLQGGYTNLAGLFANAAIVFAILETSRNNQAGV